ncbi:hypothetical protein H4R34_000869 [Dimargaris verticillata]|uniref:C2H2-type domain-containing protein n=1 Tax=Dimargaris verticillata TaxID=2761393 RepID=A0A9W8EEB2_9FUNG|nr:hypothetical protein H4R34_000869 [Dimargaris verticillata]
MDRPNIDPPQLWDPHRGGALDRAPPAPELGSQGPSSIFEPRSPLPSLHETLRHVFSPPPGSELEEPRNRPPPLATSGTAVAAGHGSPAGYSPTSFVLGSPPSQRADFQPRPAQGSGGYRYVTPAERRPHGLISPPMATAVSAAVDPRSPFPPRPAGRATSLSPAGIRLPSIGHLGYRPSASPPLMTRRVLGLEHSKLPLSPFTARELPPPSLHSRGEEGVGLARWPLAGPNTSLVMGSLPPFPGPQALVPPRKPASPLGLRPVPAMVNLEGLASASSTLDSSMTGGGSAPKTFSFVSNPGTNAKKRRRRKYDEIERYYTCCHPGCTKSYGTLNHLNSHIHMQGHGRKRSPAEFKDLRREIRRKKTAARAAATGSSQAAESSSSTGVSPPTTSTTPYTSVSPVLSRRVVSFADTQPPSLSTMVDPSSQLPSPSHGSSTTRRVSLSPSPRL